MSCMRGSGRGARSHGEPARVDTPARLEIPAQGDPRLGRAHEVRWTPRSITSARSRTSLRQLDGRTQHEVDFDAVWCGGRPPLPGLAGAGRRCRHDLLRRPDRHRERQAADRRGRRRQGREDRRGRIAQRRREGPEGAQDGAVRSRWQDDDPRVHRRARAHVGSGRPGDGGQPPAAARRRRPVHRRPPGAAPQVDGELENLARLRRRHRLRLRRLPARGAAPSRRPRTSTPSRPTCR